MVRFYSRALSAPEAQRAAASKEFEGAVKALAAFSALWRASRRGTANIDTQYREILGGSNCTAMPALARSLRRDPPEGAAAPIVDLTTLKAELRQRLLEEKRGGLADKEAFVTEAIAVPAYTNSREVSRMILLAAYHDSVEDAATPGLIKKGRPAVSPCLTYEGFMDDRNLTLEHIAPKDGSAGWDAGIYANKELVHRVGNMVLVPLLANQSFSSRAWTHKRVLYQALGAPSHADAERILNDAAKEGIEFGESTQEIIARASYMPQLSAIGSRKDAWTPEFVEERSKRLLGLAWDELYAWLQ